MTTLETKTQILADLYVETVEGDTLYDFVEVHDLGIPLAVLITQGHATATPSGVEWIVKDFDDLCEEMEIDKYGDYDSLDEMWDMTTVGPDEQG